MLGGLFGPSLINSEHARRPKPEAPRHHHRHPRQEEEAPKGRTTHADEFASPPIESPRRQRQQHQHQHQQQQHQHQHQQQQHQHQQQRHHRHHHVSNDIDPELCGSCGGNRNHCGCDDNDRIIVLAIDDGWREDVPRYYSGAKLGLVNLVSPGLPLSILPLIINGAASTEYFSLGVTAGSIDAVTLAMAGTTYLPKTGDSLAIAGLLPPLEAYNALFMIVGLPSDAAPVYTLKIYNPFRSSRCGLLIGDYVRVKYGDSKLVWEITDANYDTGTWVLSPTNMDDVELLNPVVACKPRKYYKICTPTERECIDETETERRRRRRDEDRRHHHHHHHRRHGDDSDSDSSSYYA